MQSRAIAEDRPIHPRLLPPKPSPANTGLGFAAAESSTGIGEKRRKNLRKICQNETKITEIEINIWVGLLRIGSDH